MPRHEEGSVLLWNKRVIRAIEPGFAFTLDDHVGGWRMTAAEAGSVEIEFAEGGGRRSVPVAAGDRLVSSGDDLFLFRAAASGEQPAQPATTTPKGGAR